MQRNPTFRRLVVASILFLALFTQYQVLFACEKMDSQVSTICCCDEPGGMSKGCAQGGGCLDEAGPVTNATDCCEVSYAPVTNATTTTPSASTQQVVLLDAPQPPPIPASFLLQINSTSKLTDSFITAKSYLATSSLTYMLTNRFRI